MCAVAGFGISGVETSSSATGELNIKSVRVFKYLATTKKPIIGRN
jgi:hypothetical protein